MSTHADKRVITLTSIADGSGTLYSTTFTGPINALVFALGTLANGTDLTITLERTGQAVLTKSNLSAGFINYPRIPVQDNTGADITYDGTRKVYEKIVAVEDRLKVVMADGGDTKTGTLTIIIG